MSELHKPHDGAAMIDSHSDQRSTRVTASRRTALKLFGGASVTTALSTVSSRAAHATLPTGATYFTPVAPVRLADTRPAAGIGGFTRLDGRTIRVQVAGRGGVPANATAVVLNVTVTGTGGAGFVSVYPSGTPRPEVSNANYENPGETVPNMVTVKLGANGSVDVYTFASADLIVDVSGAYAPTTVAVAAGRFVAARPAARRVLDTRSGGGGPLAGGATRRVSVAAEVPASATAVVVNLTVTNARGAGYWTAFPSGGAPPNASNLNVAGFGQTVAGQAIVKLAAGSRSFDVFAESGGGGDLIVDVAGWFTGPTDPLSDEGLFVPSTPYRAIDTRWPYGYGRTYAKWTVEFPLAAGIQAQAAAINLTTTNTRGEGYFTAYPARTALPLVSNLNASRIGQTVANHAIVRVSTAGIGVYAFGGGHILADVAGYYTGAPAPTTSGPVVNVVPAPSPLPYQLDSPVAGIDGQTIVEGVDAHIVDRGLIGHWPGTGLAGEESHMVVFGHRTSANGPFYYLHLLEPGHEIYVTGADGRRHTYRVARTDITGKDATSILNAAYSVPGATISLVACSKTNGLPTSLAYRIIVTAVLVS